MQLSVKKKKRIGHFEMRSICDYEICEKPKTVKNVQFWIKDSKES